MNACAHKHTWTHTPEHGYTHKKSVPSHKIETEAQKCQETLPSPPDTNEEQGVYSAKGDVSTLGTGLFQQRGTHRVGLDPMAQEWFLKGKRSPECNIFPRLPVITPLGLAWSPTPPGAGLYPSTYPPSWSEPVWKSLESSNQAGSVHAFLSCCFDLFACAVV